MPDRLLPNPVLANRLRMVEYVRWGLVADLLLTGPGFAVGPAGWSSASGYGVIHALPVPFPVWGWLWTTAAVLIVAGRKWSILTVAGHGLAAVVFGFWGFALAVPILWPPITGWGAPWHHLTLGGVHLWLTVVGLYDRAFPVDPQRARQKPAGEKTHGGSTSLDA